MSAVHLCRMTMDHCDEGCGGAECKRMERSKAAGGVVLSPADEIELLRAALGAITSTIDHMRAIGSWDAATMERVSDNIRQITSAARQEEM